MRHASGSGIGWPLLTPKGLPLPYVQTTGKVHRNNSKHIDVPHRTCICYFLKIAHAAFFQFMWLARLLASGAFLQCLGFLWQRWHLHISGSYIGVSVARVEFRHRACLFSARKTTNLHDYALNDIPHMCMHIYMYIYVTIRIHIYMLAPPKKKTYLFDFLSGHMQWKYQVCRHSRQG